MPRTLIADRCVGELRRTYQGGGAHRSSGTLVEPSASASDLLTGGSFNAEETAMTQWRDTMVDRPESDGPAYVTGWTVSGIVVLGAIVAVWVLGI
jgi:hypothetical protein